MRLLTLAGIAVCFGVVCSHANGADIQWTAGRGSWHIANNWSLGRVPTSGDDAQLGAGAVSARLSSIRLKGPRVRPGLSN